MYFKLHFRRDDPNYYGIETLVKIDLENDKTTLNWTELDDKHPLTHVIVNTAWHRKKRNSHSHSGTVLGSMLSLGNPQSYIFPLGK